MLAGGQRRYDRLVIFMVKDFVVHVCLSGIFRGLGDKKAIKRLLSWRGWIADVLIGLS